MTFRPQPCGDRPFALVHYVSLLIQRFVDGCSFSVGVEKRWTHVSFDCSTGIPVFSRPYLHDHPKSPSNEDRKRRSFKYHIETNGYISIDDRLSLR